ncbi:MAG: hypothetical protein ABIE22_00005, partial [archaeon]
MKVKLLTISLLVLIFSVFLSLNVLAWCWENSDYSTCVADTDVTCNWKNDSWGGWCEEVGCWSYYSQDSCPASIGSKNCSWREGSSSYSCAEVSCWIFEGTNEASCENNSYGKSCEWSAQCYNKGSAGGGASVQCWDKQNQSACLNTTGCGWGQCWEQGCWSYNDATECRAAKDWRGNNCTFKNESSSTWCEQDNCWSKQNQSACVNASGISCQWNSYGCEEIDCWTWDYTNEASCENNTKNLSCTWDGQWCMKQSCWNFWDQDSCDNKPGCIWSAWESFGMCEEVQCWSWDSWNGGNQSQCESNAYGLNCLWSSYSGDNATDGWCFMDFSSVSCSNKTTERECMDTFYCWWEFTNWNNPDLGGVCKDPEWGGGGYDSGGIFEEWNPGCYIFDMNETNCNLTLGCSYNGQGCMRQEDDYGTHINDNGLNCTHVNDSRLCNSIPMLSTCCSWQNSTCTINRMTTACWDQMTEPPTGAMFCEDYNAYNDYSLCTQIAGDPWYMPCEWNNATGNCQFKSNSVFGNASQSLTKIDNKKNCEAAGGKWITENYCEGNISVPSGRCEYKFDEEDNCKKSCFGCENKDSNGNAVNASSAESACLGSSLGFCEFTADPSAPNGAGYCKAKSQFKKGIANDCDTDCGACTFLGDPNNNDTAKRPSSFCRNSKANSAGGGCKWVIDNSTEQKGYCVNKGEKTCEDACDRCATRDNCANIGRTKIANQSGSCEWSGTDNAGTCVANIGEDVEICWDGIDNTDDTLVDCADPACYTDSFCGFVQGDCSGWNVTQCSLEHNDSCEWVVDQWGSWCDFKGSQCWKYNINEPNCTSNTNCAWTNGTGNGWCEMDWSINEQCMGLSEANCLSAESCTWTNDTWCLGGGNSTEWCQTAGGWCDHNSMVPSNCWQHSSTSNCNNDSSCSWHTDEWAQPQCEVNWTGNCWQYYDSSGCVSAGCNWTVDSWGGYCRDNYDQCWSYWNSQTNCLAVTDGSGNKLCSYSGQNCQPVCFNQTNSQDGTLCNLQSGCYWKDELGWCEDAGSSDCWSTDASLNETNCVAVENCRWKSDGWCDPKDSGFSSASASLGGGVGSMGGDCWKYDGNQSLCTNKSIINVSCGWFNEPNPWCEVNWGQECWRYDSNATLCAAQGCWFKNDSWGAHCMNAMEQCWQNESYNQWSNPSGWEDACNSNPNCNTTAWSNCEPTCFQSSSVATCQANSGCRWVTGWCNPAGMNSMFSSMESGAPIPLGGDVCDGSETNSSHVDICGFGMKDMDNAWGIGSGVASFENASICNKEKLSSFVMGGGGMGGDFGMGDFANEKIGSGNETVKYFVYLDSDGNSSLGCSFNSTVGGFEFRFRYVAEWSANTSKTVETFNVYKCKNAAWEATDVKISAWKNKMCGEMGGPMLAIEKADLLKYPTLYSSTADLRIFVATADATHNISVPSDTAGPSWTSPGSIDFSINNMMDVGAGGSAQYEDLMRQGFVSYEDCYNELDDDLNGDTDCYDWACEFADVCASAGVNAAGYQDTSSPTVTGVKIEEYPDAALIMYDTNKPTNGTLIFYGNDSQCLSKNASVYDTGILKSVVREFKLWHHAQIYNDGGTESLSFALVNDTQYYYKLKVCDSSGKCGVSKCSSFMTSSQSRCGYCNFVTRLKAPTSWVVSYDLNQNGTYDHVQGQVCGPKAGMKTNYTDGRKADVKIEKSDNSVYFEFINVTLTKSALNDKVRDFESAGSIIDDATELHVGFPAASRDKIINNLHPEKCRVKIPFTGTCNKLYHCDDDGNNCQDRTSDATLISADSCIWELPYCEFSTWDADGNPAPAGSEEEDLSSGSGGGGGGGGGANATAKEEFTPEILPGQDAGTGTGDVIADVEGGKEGG